MAAFLASSEINGTPALGTVVHRASTGTNRTG